MENNLRMIREYDPRVSFCLHLCLRPKYYVYPCKYFLVCYIIAFKSSFIMIFFSYYIIFCPITKTFHCFAFSLFSSSADISFFQLWIKFRSFQFGWLIDCIGVKHHFNSYGHIMAVGDAQVFPGFLTPVLIHLSFQSHWLLFSQQRWEVKICW